MIPVSLACAPVHNGNKTWNTVLYQLKVMNNNILFLEHKLCAGIKSYIEYYPQCCHWQSVKAISFLNSVHSLPLSLSISQIIKRNMTRIIVVIKIIRVMIFCFLKHCVLVMPNSYTDLGPNWTRPWLIAWWHQSTAWTNVDLISEVFCSIHLRTFSQEMLKISILAMQNYYRNVPIRSALPKSSAPKGLHIVPK